jgi:hypothetical protein
MKPDSGSSANEKSAPHHKEWPALSGTLQSQIAIVYVDYDTEFCQGLLSYRSALHTDETLCMCVYIRQLNDTVLIL